MARITVYIPDDLLKQADAEYLRRVSAGSRHFNRSRMVAEALARYAASPGRPTTSQRGYRETLRALRATRAALDDLEANLRQSRPVKPSVRRIVRSARR